VLGVSKSELIQRGDAAELPSAGEPRAGPELVEGASVHAFKNHNGTRLAAEMVALVVKLWSGFYGLAV
jgi:hypothetical protein